ncbi:MAG: aldo/keto reductase, partial [Hyphomicrobiales bacterium]|nr:aldo/keto reductase [Hyphomicrobiales bacterium]
VSRSGALKARARVTRAGAKLKFTEIGFGGTALGNLYRALTERAARATLDGAWDAGIRYFDVAPTHGYGLAETRINGFFRHKARDDFLVATTVGRRLRRLASGESRQEGDYFETPSRRCHDDYSYDGIMFGFDATLDRLGLDRIDVAFAHDLDPVPGVGDTNLRSFLDGGMKALTGLRDDGALAAIGATVSDRKTAEVLARHGGVDLFMLPGSYTLLRQTALDGALRIAADAGIGVVVGAPFNTGVLAAGARRGARFDYREASRETLDRVKRIEAVCATHKTKIADAALRFALAHPAVCSVAVGVQSPAECAKAAAATAAAIPAALWRDLKAEGLLRADAPVPR